MIKAKLCAFVNFFNFSPIIGYFTSTRGQSYKTLKLIQVLKMKLHCISIKGDFSTSDWISSKSFIKLAMGAVIFL